MLTLTILALACITFTTRYLFVHPRLPITLSARMQKLLSYSAPAVLSAIWFPIIFVQNHQLNTDPFNPYLIGALVAVVLAWKFKSIYVTAIGGGSTFIAVTLLLA